MFGLKEKLELTGKEMALVLIDLEPGILAQPMEPYDSDEVVKKCAALAQTVRAAGGTVVYVHVLLHEIMRLPADKPLVKPGTPPPPAEASNLVPDAGYQPGVDLLVAKRQWDAFYGTDLKAQLDAKGVKTLIMGGVMTNFGVESTARSGFAQGLAVVFAEDAMASRNKKMHEFATENTFPVMGKVRSVEEITEALSA